MGETVRSTALPRFLLLYAAMYAAFGVASPFLPALVNARGVPAAQLGLVLSAGTAVRLLTGPLAGRLSDRIQGLRVVLVVCLGLAAVVTLGYLPAQGFGPFLALSLGHAAALAPVTILADALALGAAVPPPGHARRPGPCRRAPRRRSTRGRSRRRCRHGGCPTPTGWRGRAR